MGSKLRIARPTHSSPKRRFAEAKYSEHSLSRTGSIADAPATPLRRVPFASMAADLDPIDIRLLSELERDADRTNVELSRLVGLSPAATLHRVRRLKEGGVIRAVTARVDPERAGFPLFVYIAVTVGRHDEAAHDRLQKAVADIPQVIRADWVAGETDALLEVVARSIEEPQRVQLLLSSRGGALRVTTILRLEVLKPPSPLPYEPDADPPARRVRRSRAG